MRTIDLKVDERYLAIQPGFEWRGIPSFVILTGVNGVGKTQLLKMMSDTQNPVCHSVFSDNGAIAPIILSSSMKEGLSIDGLIVYKNKLLDNLAEERKQQQFVQVYKDEVKRKEQQLRSVTDSVERKRIQREIEDNKNVVKNFQNNIKNLHEYAYDVEINRISLILGKDSIDITDDEIREYANPYFNTLTEIADFERFIRQEENERNEMFVKLSKEKRENEIAAVRDEERSFETINRLFRKYGFDYFTMLDPFPSNKSRNGAILFEGKKGELVKYDALSSGEQMIVKFIIWAMGKDIRGNRINTMLLDEPDAHLHPSMCKMMVNILHEISKPQSEGGSGIRVIITTHTPSTAAFAPEGSLFVMDKDNHGNRFVRPTDVDEAVAVLSQGVFTFDKVIKQFSMVFDSNKENVLFVEGKTDVVHLMKAMDILGYDLNVEIIDMHDATTLGNFIRSVPAKLLPDKKKLIALFDYDEAGKKAYESVKGSDIGLPLTKKVSAEQCEGKSYVMTLVAPAGQQQYCPIEFLYQKDYLETHQMLIKRDYRDFNNLFKPASPDEGKDFKEESTLRPFYVNDSRKNLFATAIKTETDALKFAGFKGTLDLIKELIEH